MLSINKDYLAEKYANISQLNKLNLSDREISEIDVNTFEGLNGLIEIWVYDNKLVRIEPGLFKGLSNLEILGLSNNLIGEIHSSMFEGLINLKNLSMNVNRLRKIEPGTFSTLLRLEILNLRNNQLYEIGSNTFEELSNLKELHLNSNLIKAIDVKAFVGLKSLEILRLENNRLKDIKTGVFSPLTNLKKLWLNENELVWIDLSAFDANTKLEELYLHGNRLVKVDWVCFRRLISQVRLITLYDNKSKLKSFVRDDYLNKKDYRHPWEKEITAKECVFEFNEFLDQLKNLAPTVTNIEDPNVYERKAGNDTFDTNLSIRSGQILDHKYKVVNLLGRESFGKTYLVLDEETKLNKVVKIVNSSDSKYLEHIDLLKKLSYDSIIKYFDDFSLQSDPKSRYIVFEYCEGGDLSSLIKSVKDSKRLFAEQKIFTWSIQATKGLKFLHANNIIHGDIRPCNLLLSPKEGLKLGDLGHEKVYEADKFVLDSVVETIFYMSPEKFEFMHSSVGEFSFQTDIWSLGCVIYELLFLKVAFPRGQFANPEIPDLGNTLFFSRILKKMLKKEWKKRITSESLYDILTKTQELIMNDD